MHRRSYDGLAFTDKAERSDKWPTVHVKEQKAILQPCVADLPRLSQGSELCGLVDLPWSPGLQRCPHI